MRFQVREANDLGADFFTKLQYLAKVCFFSSYCSDFHVLTFLPEYLKGLLLFGSLTQSFCSRHGGLFQVNLKEEMLNPNVGRTLEKVSVPKALFVWVNEGGKSRFMK